MMLELKNININHSKTSLIGDLNLIVKEEMAIRSKLLEEVAQRILDRFFDEIPMIQKATVGVSKINPPIGGNVEEVVIVLTKKQ